MARRITPSQFRSKMRQIESKQNRAVAKFKREAKRAVAEYNREVRTYNSKVRQRHQALGRAIDEYNRKVKAHSAAVRVDRNRQRAAIGKLRAHQAAPQFVGYVESTSALQDAFDRIEPASVNLTEEHVTLLDIAARETQRGLDTANLIVTDEPMVAESDSGVDEDVFALSLAEFSDDLARRWSGAVYALSPNNPDAARHFCTSVREIFTEILDGTAPNADVMAHDPLCQKTPNGTPSRRAKILYLMALKGIKDLALADFAEKDIENTLSLFAVFNRATHGPAGSYSIEKLNAIKNRVQESVLFLASIAT